MPRAKHPGWGAWHWKKRIQKAFENWRTGEDPEDVIADLIASTRLDEATACRAHVRHHNGIDVAREEIGHRLKLHRQALRRTR
jgi:hypothetical protein